MTMFKVPERSKGLKLLLFCFDCLKSRTVLPRTAILAAIYFHLWNDSLSPRFRNFPIYLDSFSSVWSLEVRVEPFDLTRKLMLNGHNWRWENAKNTFSCPCPSYQAK